MRLQLRQICMLIRHYIPIDQSTCTIFEPVHAFKRVRSLDALLAVVYTLYTPKCETEQARIKFLLGCLRWTSFVLSGSGITYNPYNTPLAKSVLFILISFSYLPRKLFSLHPSYSSGSPVALSLSLLFLRFFPLSFHPSDIASLVYLQPFPPPKHCALPL